MAKLLSALSAIGWVAACTLATGAIACSKGLPITEPDEVAASADGSQPLETQQLETLRVATFNIWELGHDKVNDLSPGGLGAHPQLVSAAEVIQRVRPDILLLNEIDFDAEAGEIPRLFVERYLKVGQGGQQAIDYPHIFYEPSNTGVPSGHDLDNDGKLDGPADGYGFGHYPGQYAMALLSRLPIDSDRARTFRWLLWRDVANNLMPNGESGKPEWYSAEELEIMRLSSKSHWDVPIQIGSATLHILASHPTPPVFDGEEDRNGRRNFDEIRLWADYLTGGQAAGYIVDDAGGKGGLPAAADFVILGDLNADPFSDIVYGRTAISQLLEHPRVVDPQPRGDGGASVDRPYSGPGELRTAAYGRIDYALPSHTLLVPASGVFWPGPEDPLHRLVSGEERASDHALVWVDVTIATR